MITIKKDFKESCIGKYNAQPSNVVFDNTFVSTVGFIMNPNCAVLRQKKEISAAA